MGDRKKAIEFHNQAVTSANDRTQPEYLNHAYRLFSSSVFVDPSFGEAWYCLGNANYDQNRPLAAIAAWRRALEGDLPHDVQGKCLNNLAWQLQATGRVHEAYDILKDVTLRWPELEQVWLNFGVVLGLLGKTKESVAAHRKAVEVGPDVPINQFGLGLALLFDRQYQEGYQWFESRLAYRLHSFLKYPYPKWEGQEGKTLFLVADQGLGDTLSYARFVEEAAKRCKFIHMVVQKELMRTFSQAWAHLPNLNIMPLASVFLDADYWSTFVSLPHALGLTDEQIVSWPQIKMPVYGMQTSWMVPDRKFHIGIAWAGSPLNDIDRHRNIPLEQFLELYRMPGVQLYSLQVGERSMDLQNGMATAVVRDLSSYIADVTDTVSILRELDLVISVESALGHICAAAGIECWIPYSSLGHDYRLGHRGEIGLWTPRHRVFCQQLGEPNWNRVFEDITESLREKTHGHLRKTTTQIQVGRSTSALRRSG